jgi:carboxypeptidase Q
MRRVILASAAVSLALAPLSLRAQERMDAAGIARIRAEGMDSTKSRALAIFNQLTNILGPRLTGSPLHKQAADWSLKQLNDWGLTGGHLEPFPFGAGWTLDHLTLEMTKPRYFPAYGYPQAWSPSTKGTLTKTVYLGNKTQAQIEAMGEQLRGAIILPTRPQTQFHVADRVQPANVDGARIGAPAYPGGGGSVTPQNTIIQIATRLGAGALLLPNAGEHGTAFVLGGSRTPAPDALPRVVMVAEHYNMIARLLESGAPVEMRVNVQATFNRADTNSYNVIAEIPGVDPVLRNEIVLVGAHLDSWHSATGATDNADASAAVLEAARILKMSGVRPRRTIRIALWSGEEQGLLGARAHLAKHFGDSASRNRLAVYLNDDPGLGATFGWYMENNTAAKAIFDQWLEPLKDLGLKRNVIGPIGSTDHVPYADLGLPAFTTIKDYTFYDYRSRHSNTDFFERVSEAELKQSATVMAIFAYNAAMRDEKIPRGTPRGRGRGGR